MEYYFTRLTEESRRVQRFTNLELLCVRCGSGLMKGSGDTKRCGWDIIEGKGQ